jgi:ligand-binding SRPBCC domain-containing protein
VFQREFQVQVRASLQEVWEFHSSAAALTLLTPADREIRAISENLEVIEGALHVFGFKQFGLPMVWKARISKVEPPFTFTDTAEKSPFKFWEHRHTFSANEHGTLIHDLIRYQPPGGPLAGLIDRLLIAKDLDRLFRFRHEATRRALDKLDSVPPP